MDNRVFLNTINNNVVLRDILENNRKLKERVFDSADEDINGCICDWLDCFERGAVDYSLDVSGYYNYFKVKNNVAFLDGILACNNTYGINQNIDVDFIPHLIDRCEFLRDCDCGYYDISNKNYNSLERWIDSKIEHIRALFYADIRANYDACFDNDFLFETFQNDIENGRYDNCYVVDGVVYEILPDRKLA